MKRFFLFLTVLILGFFSFAQDKPLKDQIRGLASTLESKYTGRDGIKAALLEFRTSNDVLTKFNDFIRDEFVVTYQNSSKFSLIDPMTTAKIALVQGWSLQKVTSFTYYDELGKKFMEQAGYVPNAYLYGEIRDNDLSITITAYLVLAGSTDAKAVAAITFNSDEQTDAFLGKPVKFRPKKQENPPQAQQPPVPPQPQVVPQPQPQPQPQPVAPQPQPQPQPQAPQAPQPALVFPSADFGTLTFKITDVKFVGQSLNISFLLTSHDQLDQDVRIIGETTRFFDSQGNEYVDAEKVLGSTRSGYSVRKNIVSEVPVRGEIIFSNVPPSAEIKMLEVGFLNGKISFRDVPVTR